MFVLLNGILTVSFKKKYLSKDSWSILNTVSQAGALIIDVN